MPLVTRMDLDNIMLSEISYSCTDKCYMISLKCGIQNMKNLELIDRENRLVVARGMGKID